MRIDFIKFFIPHNTDCYSCGEKQTQPWIWHIEQTSYSDTATLYPICYSCYNEKYKTHWEKYKAQKLANIKAKKLAIIEEQRHYYNWHTNKYLIKQHQEDNYYPWESLDTYLPLKEPKNE